MEQAFIPQVAENPEVLEALPVERYVRPSWIRDDPQDPMALRVEHPEACGRFVIVKPTLRVETARQRIFGRELGLDPTDQGEMVAEWLATLSVGFSEVPENAPRITYPGMLPEQEREAPFDPGALVDEELISALFEEVASAWQRFRRQLAEKRRNFRACEGPGA